MMEISPYKRTLLVYRKLFFEKNKNSTQDCPCWRLLVIIDSILEEMSEDSKEGFQLACEKVMIKESDWPNGLGLLKYIQVRTFVDHGEQDVARKIDDKMTSFFVNRVKCSQVVD